MIHRHPFVQSVETALREHCGVTPGDRLLVAVSGGADSVALLSALHAILKRPHWRLDLHVAHVHHHLRPTADADAALVGELAETLGLPHHRRDVMIGPAGNVEAAARRRRYAALAEVAEAVGATAIATAHHADDQMETMLMRLVRGAAIKGLAGIADRKRIAGAVVVRPMLGLDHAAAEAFCAAAGRTWREDPTNADRTRWRARLRAEVLPVLRELRPDAATKAVEASRQLRQAGGIVDRRVDEIAESIVADEPAARWFNRGDARALTPAELTALLRRLAVALGVRADRLPNRLLDRIARTIRTPGGESRRFDLAGGAAVEVERDQVTLTGPTAADRT